ncbi:MAG: recombinase family protein [Acidimicrobiales bacterium]
MSRGGPWPSFRPGPAPQHRPSAAGPDSAPRLPPPVSPTRPAGPDDARLQAAGRSLGQIAENLNDQEHKTRREKRWSKSQVKRVLDRGRPA